MSENPYERVKGGRLTFKGGAVASRSKTIDKKKRKKKNTGKQEQQQQLQFDDVDAHVVGDDDDDVDAETPGTTTVNASGEVIYTIDAAKKMKYEDLFPVEAKKFGYDPKAKAKSIEDALDDRVKKKADRYCK